MYYTSLSFEGVVPGLGASDNAISIKEGVGMINGDRLWSRLGELAEIGRDESSGGITRLSSTGEERGAKELVASYMREANLFVREDAAGNLIGRREGSNPESPVLLIGSHVDTVYEGGAFDGALGVLAGVEALQVMDEQGITTSHPIEVVPNSIGQAARAESSVKAYLEVHIEQGKVLEDAGLSAGVVEGIASILWRRFTIVGEAGHAGTTPMTLRKDPLPTAAGIVQVIEQKATETGSTVGTVGQLEVSPGGINIIPGEVRFTMDLRDLSEQVRDTTEQSILTQAKELCTKRGVELNSKVLQRVEAAPCSQEIQRFAKEACEELGLDPITLPSGAGHDGMQLKGLCEIGMIFVRSKNGISHSPGEWSDKEDCVHGTGILYQTALRLTQLP